MGMPLVIDNLVLTLGRFIWNREQERAVFEGGMDRQMPASGTARPEHITLSSGQMLLPGISSPYTAGN